MHPFLNIHIEAYGCVWVVGALPRNVEGEPLAGAPDKFLMVEIPIFT